MGKDKYENEELLKYAFPEDIWFHVSNLSSAHVYVRLPKGKTFEDLPQEVIEDCAQLVKANSIQGSKEPSVLVDYTPWTNLKKTQDMGVGVVAFHDMKLVKKIKVQKSKEILSRLNKTKIEKNVDLKQMREDYDKEVRAENKRLLEEQKRKEREEIERKKQEEDLLHYKAFMQEDKMRSNKHMEVNYKSANDYEEDFM
jgi:hypothetical protein